MSNPSPLDLTSSNKVQEWMVQNGQAQTKELNVIQDAITAFSVDFLRWTGRGPQDGSAPDVINGTSPYVTPTSYFDVIDGNGNPKIPLRNWPIQSVSALTWGGRSVQPSSGPIGAATVNSGGSGYTVGDLPAVDGGSGGVVAVATVDGTGAVTGVTIQTAGQGYVTGAHVTTTGGTGAGLTVNLIINPQSVGYVIDGSRKYLALVNGGGNLGGGVLAANFQNLYSYRSAAGRLVFPQGVQNICINYTAGFNGVPNDIDVMVRRCVAMWYKQRGEIGLASKAAPGGAGTVTYNWKMSKEDDAVIEFYKRRAMVP